VPTIILGSAEGVTSGDGDATGDTDGELDTAELSELISHAVTANAKIIAKPINKTFFIMICTPHIFMIYFSSKNALL